MLAAAHSLGMSVGAGNAQTVLNSTTFDGTEPTADTGGPGFANQGTLEIDTVNGWRWYTENSATNPITLGAGFSTWGTTIGEQEIRTNELQSADSRFSLEWGGSGVVDALVQDFSASAGQTVTIDLESWVSANRAGLMWAWADGSANFDSPTQIEPRGTEASPATTQLMFTPTQSTFKIGFFGNLGADTNARINSIVVTQVPEPSAVLLGLVALSGAVLIRRRN